MSPGERSGSIAEFSDRLLGFGDVLRENTAAVRRVEQKMDRMSTQLPFIRIATIVAVFLSIFAVSYTVWSRNDINNLLEKNALAAPAPCPPK